MYDIACREGNTIAEVRQKAILNREDPDKIDITAYNPEDWRADRESEKSSDEASLKAAVQIKGEKQHPYHVVKREHPYHEHARESEHCFL